METLQKAAHLVDQQEKAEAEAKTKAKVVMNKKNTFVTGAAAEKKPTAPAA